MTIHKRWQTTFSLLFLSLGVVITGCARSAPDPIAYSITLPTRVHIEYEVREAIQDQGTYIKIDQQAYFHHARSDTWTSTFFLIEGNNIGFNDGKGDIQDYMTYRQIAGVWMAADSWSYNINYYSLMGSGSWSPYQSGTVDGPLRSLSKGTAALNSPLANLTKLADQTLNIDGEMIVCDVYLETETAGSGAQMITMKTKYWMEKTSRILMKLSRTFDVTGDIDQEEFIDFIVTKYIKDERVAFPSGMPQLSGG